MEDLTGSWVLVHPELTTDPAKHQGQIGIITSSDLNRDEVRVGFGHAPVALYSTDALLVIKPHDNLYRDLLTNVKEMEAQDFKTLLRISMILQNGSPRQLKDALEMVLASENTLKFGTISLQDKLGLAMEKQVQVEQHAGVAR